MSAETEYTVFLAGLRLRHFNPREVTSYAEEIRNRVPNALPGRQLWPNIVATLWVVDHLRDVLEAPVWLTSIYRSPEYNASVGGVANSQHLRNAAIDFQSSRSPAECMERLQALRSAGMFRGGLGLYETFVHVDTRGVNADWTG